MSVSDRSPVPGEPADFPVGEPREPESESRDRDKWGLTPEEHAELDASVDDPEAYLTSKDTGGAKEHDRRLIAALNQSNASREALALELSEALAAAAAVGVENAELRKALEEIADAVRSIFDEAHRRERGYHGAPDDVLAQLDPVLACARSALAAMEGEETK